MLKEKAFNILAIDTSGVFLSVAILQRSKLIARHHSMVGQRHSELLVPTIGRLLKKTKFDLKNLDCLAVSVGPGSFTGLRIGVATIKGLSLAIKKPVVCVPTLKAIAKNVTGRNVSLICPIVDARRENVYSATYRNQSGLLKQSLKTNIFSLDTLIVKLRQILDKKKCSVIFTGDGLKNYKDKISRKLGKRTLFATEKFWYPKAETIAKLAGELFSKKQVVPLDELKPIYLYPKDVQCRKN